MSIGIFIYFLLTVGSIYLSIIYLEFSAMQLMWIVLLLPVFMGVILFLLRRSITVSVVSKNPVYEMKSLKEPASVVITIKVKNVSKILPLSKGVVFLQYQNIFSGEKGRKKLFFSIDNNCRVKKEQNIEIRHCGGLQVKVKKVKIYDYLSIFSSKIKNVKIMETVVVLPPLKEVSVEDELLFNEGEESSERYSPYKKGDDPSEIFDIRDFKEGDKLQQIHWKLSYKKDSLMVKEYSLPLARETNIFVDFYVRRGERHPFRKIDLLIQGVYSYTMALMEKSIPIRLVWYDNVDGMVKAHIVINEEELMWVFREMFQSRLTHNDEEFIAAYVEWGMGKPMETGIYMTVCDGSKISGESLGVRHLHVIKLHEAEEGGI